MRLAFLPRRSHRAKASRVIPLLRGYRGTGAAARALPQVQRARARRKAPRLEAWPRRSLMDKP